jgi:hypothetical protein
LCYGVHGSAPTVTPGLERGVSIWPRPELNSGRQIFSNPRTGIPELPPVCQLNLTGAALISGRAFQPTCGFVITLIVNIIFFI